MHTHSTRFQEAVLRLKRLWVYNFPKHHTELAIKHLAYTSALWASAQFTPANVHLQELREHACKLVYCKLGAAGRAPEATLMLFNDTPILDPLWAWAANVIMFFHKLVRKGITPLMSQAWTIAEMQLARTGRPE
eukprot:670769-Amphidinium_carterae.1